MENKPGGFHLEMWQRLLSALAAVQAVTLELIAPLVVG
jgi:hypothetical protein